MYSDQKEHFLISTKELSFPVSPVKMVSFKEVKDHFYFVIEVRGFRYRVSKTFKIFLFNMITIEFQLLVQI